MGKKRILFITPLASRTGSEMMIWYIIHHIDRSKYEVALASYANGELLQELPEGVKSYLIPGTFGLVDRLKFHLGIHPIVEALKSIQNDFKADLWYLNTIVLPNAVPTAIQLNIPYVVHFHEMPLSFLYVKEQEFRQMIDNAHHLIGCSAATCDGIKQAGGKKVSLVHSFIDSNVQQVDQADVIRLRTELGIQPNDFVWVMSGTTSERKGFDFLPEIAEQINDAQVHLVWVGGRLSDGYVSWVENRIKTSTWKTNVHTVGKQTHLYSAYCHLADGFMLTSRQDPFPLVMIEAASLGKPIVAFPSGGASEFITEGVGIVTEDISVRQMVGAMRQVMAGSVTNADASKARAAQFNVESGIKELQLVIENII